MTSKNINTPDKSQITSLLKHAARENIKLTSVYVKMTMHNKVYYLLMFIFGFQITNFAIDPLKLLGAGSKRVK